MPPPLRFDASFADAMRASFTGPVATTDALLDHRALRAIERTQPGDSVSRTLLFENARVRAQRRMPTWRTLDMWRTRGDELVAAADEAGAYLPPAVKRFPGTIFLVVGYEGSIPAPPDLIIDVTIPSFEERPNDLDDHVLHEAHHVGFMRVREAPVLTTLTDRKALANLVWSMTQREGMAVHAGFGRRERKGTLASDFDYESYTSVEAAERITKRFAKWRNCLTRPKPLERAEAAALLDALATGERLFHRFGALVANRFEQANGREELVATVLKPEAYVRTAETLLAQTGEQGCALDVVANPVRVDEH